jgi:hypothetical protein
LTVHALPEEDRRYANLASSFQHTIGQNPILRLRLPQLGDRNISGADAPRFFISRLRQPPVVFQRNVRWRPVLSAFKISPFSFETLTINLNPTFS